MDRSRFFTLVVIGENPDEMIKPYDSNNEVEPYVVYEYAKRGEYRQKHIDILEKIVEMGQHPQLDLIKQRLEEIKEMDDIDFYLEITEGKPLDENTGNLMSNKNPNGRYDACTIGDEATVYPLILKSDDSQVFQARKGDVNWEKVHLYDKPLYERIWEMVIDGSEPQNDIERECFDRMRFAKEYLKHYGTPEVYAINQSAFWGYAVVTKDGWTELENNIDPIDWVANFYDTYIKNLSDDTLITIYSCYRK